MIRITIDYYMPPDDAFYVHIEEPDRDPSIRRDPFWSQSEWIYAAQLAKRIRKHLKRVGLNDRVNIDPAVAKQLGIPKKQNVELAPGFPVHADRRKSKW